jgi:hypothetical protein
LHNGIDPRLADAVGSAFGSAAASVRAWASNSAKDEDDGQRGTREDSFTDWVIDQIRSHVPAALQQRGNVGRASVNITSTNIPVSEENRIGADLGLRLTILTNEARITKGVIIQCKRMYAPSTSPSFKAIRGDGERQAMDMLTITPASMFMLYSFGRQEQLLELAGLSSNLVCPACRGRAPSDLLIGNIRWEGLPAWDMGISVIPASRILALSTYSKSLRKPKPMPIDAATILRGAVPLGVFMVDYLLSCFVGDPRFEVVSICTPPAKRAAAVGQITDSDPLFSRFSVRHFIDIAAGNLG